MSIHEPRHLSLAEALEALLALQVLEKFGIVPDEGYLLNGQIGRYAQRIYRSTDSRTGCFSLHDVG